MLLRRFLVVSGVLGMAGGEIVIVGGGLAGLSAALEAANRGAAVHLIEGEKDVGGNSAKASSGMNGVGTPTQAKLKIQDSVDEFIKDTMSAGDEGNAPELVSLLVRQSAEAVAFVSGFGVDLGDVNLCGGHSHPRTHWIPSPKEGRPMPVGITIIRALKAGLEKLAAAEPGRVRISVNTSVRELLEKDGRVVGLKVQRRGEDGQLGTLETMDSDVEAVILTTGGFSNDHTDTSLLEEFAPQRVGYPSTNGLFAQGAGVKMGRGIGARLRDMKDVQVHPTAFIDPKDPKAMSKFLAAEALRGKGAILVDGVGRRFANELGRRDYVSKQIEDHCPMNEAAGRQTAWMLMNTAAVDSFGWPAFNFYFKIKKFFTEFASVADLAAGTGMDEAVILETFATYGSGPDEFGKAVIPVKFVADSGPFYAARVTPALHYTMGGLAIDADARVLRDADGAAFRGFFAAGEVAGGVHGHNRLGGNSLLECVVFGRIAGRSAAHYASAGDKNEL